MVDIIKNILIPENNLINSDGIMYSTIDVSIKTTGLNNIITGSNNITLRKISVKLVGLDKMYMKKHLIEVKLYQTKRKQKTKQNEK